MAAVTDKAFFCFSRDLSGVSVKNSYRRTTSQGPGEKGEAGQSRTESGFGGQSRFRWQL